MRLTKAAPVAGRSVRPMESTAKWGCSTVWSQKLRGRVLREA